MHFRDCIRSLFSDLLCCGGFPILPLPYSLFWATCSFLSVSCTVSVSPIHFCFYFIRSQCGWQHLFIQYVFCPLLPNSLSLSPRLTSVLCPCFTPISPPCFVIFIFTSLSVSLGPDFSWEQSGPFNLRRNKQRNLNANANMHNLTNLQREIGHIDCVCKQLIKAHIYLYCKAETTCDCTNYDESKVSV